MNSPRMSDAELAEYCGFKPTDNQEAVARFIADLSPDRRALYDRMREVEFEASLWAAGLGPKPTGVIICGPREIREGGRRKKSPPSPRKQPE